MRDFQKEIKKASNEMSRTVVVDLDGVIVDFKNCKENCDYSGYPEHITLRREKCPLDPEAVDVLREFKKAGLTIIINTSRVEEEREVTEQWLREHDVPYDRLVTMKPRGFVYLDDLAHKFVGWKNAKQVVLGKYATFEERAEVYKEAQEKWGEWSQILVAIEEFGELITVLAKRNRNLNGATVEDIRNEIADAMVMLEHLQIIFGKEECEKIQRYKVERLKSWFKNVDKMIE